MNQTKLLIAMALTGLLASTAAQAATSAGGMRLVTRQKTCEMTVPAGWKINKWLKSRASAPDDSATAGLSSPDTGYNLSQAKPIVEGSLKPIKIFEDTPRRFWYQYKTSAGPGIGWYVGVPFKDGICTALIAFKNTSQTEMIKKIVMSVKAIR
ncbi:MAG: hypothetical protein ACRER1_05680 [Gammaproteobacteria bacterium]